MGIWKRRYSDSGHGELSKLEKEMPNRQNEDEFIFEFREAIVRQEFTESERREDLSGELQGEQGESQPVERTDDAEARAEDSR